MAIHLFQALLRCLLMSLFCINLQAEPLPEPLTLDAALASVTPDHPAIAKAAAAQQLAIAYRDISAATNDLSLDLSLQARRIEPSEFATLQQRDDSRATLTLHKTLYDFGRTQHATQAGEQNIAATKDTLALAISQQKRTIMQRFFEVDLSDLFAAQVNEAMSVAFVRLDNSKERHKLGEISDIDLLKLENEYQQQLLNRKRAEDQQRQARTRLALALNRPGELSSEIEPAELPGNTSPLPDHDVLLEESIKNNLSLHSLKKQQQALDSQRNAAQAARRPELFIELQAAEYQREFSSRDPVTAILGLDIPLYQGNRVNAQISRREAQISQLKAQIRQSEFELRQDILDTWQNIQTLTAQLKQAEIRSDYRDLYLDRSRARYDLEINTDFGDAMVQQTAARWFSAKTRYDLALAREKLVELTGNPRYSALRKIIPSPSSKQGQQETP
ncbi:MAG TPA: TolC family protein [Gammaproteobacteria bacterium]|nr:TolC family protein [Gammaproteobacteria bacterium]